MFCITVQSGNSFAFLFGNHELGHELEAEEKNGLKYFWLNTIPAQGKKFHVLPSFHKEWFSQ